MLRLYISFVKRQGAGIRREEINVVEKTTTYLVEPPPFHKAPCVRTECAVVTVVV